MKRERLERWCEELEASPRTVSTEELLRFLRTAGATTREGNNHGPVIALGQETMTIPRNRRELSVRYVKRAIQIVRDRIAQVDALEEQEHDQNR
jgi:hypothetical protein